MNMQGLYDRLLPHFRRKRAILFHDVFGKDVSARVLDVGGYWYNWGYFHIDGPIVCLNSDPAHTTQNMPDRFSYVLGDARDLDFGDDAFEIGYSNSVIEHVGGFDDQRRFANEIQRVCRYLFVQTPSRWFVLEPHLLTPFFHYLPRWIQYRCVRWCTVWGWVTRPSREEGAAFLDSIRLLTYREMAELFPDCEIYRERVAFFFVKSFVAIKRPSPQV